MFKRVIGLLLWGSLWASSPLTPHFAKGKDLAVGHELPMALVFTGSDWSAASKDLLNEIAQHPPIEMVLVHVDFPEMNGQNAETLQQNQTLKETYQITHFPTVVLINSEQEEIARMGYPIEGVSHFGEHLRKAGRRYFLLKKRFEAAKEKKAMGELKVCYQEARALGAEALAQAILEEGKEVPELMLEKYIHLLGTEEGAVLRHKLNEVATREVAETLALLDFQEGKGVAAIEKTIEKFGDRCWKMHVVLSEFLEEKEAALEHAQVSHRYAPPEEKSNIERLISRMLPSKSLSESQTETEKDCN